MSNDPRMPDNLNTMYERIVEATIALGYGLVALAEYGVPLADIRPETTRRLNERSRALPDDEAERMDKAVELCAQLTGMVTPLSAAVKIDERLARAERETGTPAAEAIIMLRGGGHGLRGLLSQEGTGLKMLCPDASPSGRTGTLLGNEVFFDYEDVVAVGFPASITIEGSKIHMS